MAMVKLSKRPISCITFKEEKSRSNDSSILQTKNDKNKSDFQKENEYNKIIKQLKYPFNSNTPGHNLTVNKNSIITPGPGTYENTLSLKAKPPLNNFEKNLFVCQSPRFQKINLSEENFPGPGAYNINNNNSIIEEYNKKRNLNKLHFNNINLKYSVNSLNNISTIPTKDQKFGYLYDENGDLIVAEDPNKFDKFSGKKNDSVGPGRYNPIFHKENNQIVDWGRMSERILKINNNDDNYQKSTKDDILSFLNLNNDDNNSINSKVDTDVSSIHFQKNNSKTKKNKLNYREKFLEYRNKLFRQNSKIIKKDKKKEEDMQKEKEDLYEELENKRKYPINFNLLRYHYKPEKFQFFGSSSERNSLSYISQDQINNVGPCYYFQNEYKKNDNKKLNKCKSQMNYRINNKIKKAVEQNLFYKKNPLIGPGTYNIENSMIKKSFSNFQGFSCERRERINKNDEIKKSFPGPGAYSLPDQFNEKNLKNKFIHKSYFVNLNDSIKKNMLGEEEQKPDFNYYQNDKFVNNLQNNIESKINKYQNKIAPFSSMEKRFKNEKLINSVNLGPGKYDIPSFIKENNNLNKFPFNSTSDRNNLLKSQNYSIGPGRYDCDNYFSWNKKSFNVMFV